jgi:eukaryotic-like serine/threonine-protein kinase
MRLIRGEELAKKFEEYHASVAKGLEPLNGLKLRGLLRRLVEVCNTMAYAHSRGVVHRDLKPANLMVGAYGETLVVDWGLAKPHSTTVEFSQVDSEVEFSGVEGPVEFSKASLSETYQGAIVGTPLYAPPEQLLGKLDAIDHRSDIYSLGIILYELLTGSPPLRKSTLAELMHAVTNGTIKKPREVAKSIPKPLEAICLKAIKPQQSERYQDVLELRRDIERFLDDRPVSVYAETLSERALRWMRHHGPLVRAAAISLIVVAIVSMLAGYRMSIARDREAKAKDDATRLLKIARETTDQLLSNAQDRLEDIPDAADVQELLLQDAAEAYRRIAEVATQDPELRRETASALSGLASIQKSLDKPQEAIASLLKSIEIQVKLTAEASADDGKALAHAQVELSRIYSDQQKLPEASKAIQAALAVCAGLPQDDARSLLLTGQAKIQQAIIRFDQGDELTAIELNKEAARKLQDALEKSRQEASTASDELAADIRFVLGRALTNEAYIGSESQKLSSDEVARLFGDALQQHEWVFENFPSRKLAAKEYADTQRALADHYIKTENFDAAQKLSVASYEKSKQLHEKYPQQLDYKNSSILSLVGLASIDESRRGEYAEQAETMANELLGFNSVKKRYRLTAAQAFIYQAQMLIATNPEHSQELSLRTRELIAKIPESKDDATLLESIRADCDKVEDNVEAELLLNKLDTERVEGLQTRLEELLSATSENTSDLTQYNVAAKVSAGCQTLTENNGASTAEVLALLDSSVDRLKKAMDISANYTAEQFLKFAADDEDFACLRTLKPDALRKLGSR